MIKRYTKDGVIARSPKGDVAISKRTTRGQTALILILLSAAALIFFAITLNWGRVTQTKTMLTVAADQGAALLASDAASYGEMQKQGNLGNKNQYSTLGGWFLDIFMVIVAVAIAIATWGAATGAAAILISHILLVMSVVASVSTLVLQLAWIQPMITSMWNKAQRNQPVAQQFYEQGVSTALQGTVTDQVNINDYFDSNANGLFNDTIGRFALFYGERLKMLNQPDIPQVVLFYNRLGVLLNGNEYCSQNVTDHNTEPDIPISAPTDTDLTATDCRPCAADYAATPTLQTLANTDCTKQITNSFQLNDSCLSANSDPNSSTYNSYCDPCCQIQGVKDPFYCAPNSTSKCEAPLSCDPDTKKCKYNPLHPNPYKTIRPASCGDPLPPNECVTNNPYGTQYPFIYDPSYQNYVNPKSFLAKFGRDMQAPLLANPPFPSTPTPSVYNLTLQGDFPNGIFPFFWLMKDYSPEVDGIDPGSLQSSQVHWCVAPTAANGVSSPSGYVSPSNATLTEFPDLNQLTLGYACQGKDCCVGALANSILNNVPAINGTGTTIDMVGSPAFPYQTNSAPPLVNPALDPSFGESNSGTWLEGDNQFCSATAPYNASSSNAPDGLCEWYGNTDVATSTATIADVMALDKISPLSGPPSADPNKNTIDSLDDTMHTLSDFVNFSHIFLNQNIDTLSSTFNTWYSQAAEWIAPACNESDVIKHGIFFTMSPICNEGQDGRLLSIYYKDGYPGLADRKNNPASGKVDKLGDWNKLITAWLNNNYANNGTWCVPTGPTGFTNEDNAITNNGTVTWGTLPSVINCLNYNANTLPATSTMPAGPAYNYQTCLNDLKNQSSSSCSLPASCAPAILGRSLAGPAPQFNQSTNSSSNTNTCPSGSTSGCTNSDNTNTTSDPGVGSTTTDVNTNTCNYNCQTTTCDCTPAPAVTCPSSCVPTPFHPCDCIPTAEVTCPSCTPTTTCSTCTNTTTTTTFKSLSCDPTVPGSYANWVQNSYTLANDEAPKFALRAQFLNDVYSRAQAMQTIFKQGDDALTSFLKPCGASDCSDGGPAAQLIYARSLGSPAAALPNSVIYGWVDGPPGGGSGGCGVDSLSGMRVGCAHIVKVTAYAPGRGGAAYTVNVPPNNPQGRFWDSLPFIKTKTGFIHRSFTLLNRDGPVYVSVKRWDEEHSNPVTFPNGHSLWQFMFHNPNLPKANNNGPQKIGGGSIGQCVDINGFGFGLTGQTVNGLKYIARQNHSSWTQDKTSPLASAFMLNDKGILNCGSGKNKFCVDANATDPNYIKCMQQANQLLDTAPESHVCAQYIASNNANECPGGSGNCSNNGDSDYTLKFFSCGQLNDDL